MMDVGSKAGYYTSKSPKLHLYEVRQEMRKGAGAGAGRHTLACTMLLLLLMVGSNQIYHSLELPEPV
jgi:hypothetical protein